jgi:hypothetical protein
MVTWLTFGVSLIWDIGSVTAVMPKKTSMVAAMSTGML